MERDEVLAMMTTLKLAGMRTAYDDILADGLKRRHLVQKIIGPLLKAEVADKTSRSIKYQMASAKLPAATEPAEFDFAASPVNEPLIRDLGGGGFLGARRNIVLERVCRDIAPCTATCYSIKKAAGVRENGSAWMNNADLAERLAGRPGMNKVAAKDAVDGVFETIGDTLAIGEETRILGFGTFATRNRPGRTAGTPRTGENVTVAASTIPVLKTGKPLKDAVNSRNTAPTRLGRDPGTYEASEGQQVEIIRFRRDDRRRCPLLRADRRSEAKSGTAMVGMDAAGRLRQNRQKRVHRNDLVERICRTATGAHLFASQK